MPPGGAGCSSKHTSPIAQIDTSSELLVASAEAAATALSTAQAAALESMVSTLSLESKNYPAEIGFDAFTLAGGSGSVKAYDAPGQTNVAWCSHLDFSAAGTTLSRVTAWCGPLTDVPHLVVSTIISAGAIDLFIDFRPRADAGYELRQPDGS